MKAIRVTTKKTDRDFKRIDQENEKLKIHLKWNHSHHAPGHFEALIAANNAERDQLEEAIRRPLADVLDKINGKAKTYTVDADGVISLALGIEEMLRERGVKVKNLVGTEVCFRPAGKSACNAYAKKAGPSITTHVELSRVSDGWRLTDAVRDQCSVNEPELLEVTVTQAAIDDIIQTATNGIWVHD